MLIDHYRKHPLTMIIDICLSGIWGDKVSLRNCEIFRHHVLNNYNYIEICEAYNIKITNLYKILYDAKKTLQEDEVFYRYLKKYCPIEDIKIHGWACYLY